MGNESCMWDYLVQYLGWTNTSMLGSVLFIPSDSRDSHRLVRTVSLPRLSESASTTPGSSNHTSLWYQEATHLKKKKTKLIFSWWKYRTHKGEMCCDPIVQPNNLMACNSGFNICGCSWPTTFPFDWSCYIQPWMRRRMTFTSGWLHSCRKLFSFHFNYINKEEERIL